MKEGDIVLAEIPQANDFKLRPALILKIMPPFGDFLLCGISTQLLDSMNKSAQSIAILSTAV